MVKCLLCERYASKAKKNQYRDGCEAVRVGDVKAHLTTGVHAEAVAAFYANANKETAVHQLVQQMTASNVEFDKFKPYFNNAYWLASRRRPFNDFGPLCKLSVLNGCENIGTSLYHNNHAGTEFMEAIDSVLDSELREALNADKSMPLGVQCDESTSYKDKHLIVYVTYMDTDQWIPKTK